MNYEEYKEESRRVGKKNDELIAQWKAIPWWRFWQRPSFEEQKSIILNNWADFYEKVHRREWEVKKNDK